MPSLDPELKKAIVRMPAGEKDKLLLRLITKDPLLTERLQFELIEGSTTTNERRDAIKQFIDRTAKLKQDSAGWVMMDMRTASGYISRHVKVTKDKYGDVELSLYLLNTFYDHHMETLRHYGSRTDKAAQYIAKRTEQMLKKLTKLDPDYFIEFEGDVNRLLPRVHNSCAAYYARQLTIPQRWSA
ncbi:hypothetical protein GCM10023189_06020 [Nibrella saemangeumensis]|uniref:Uncharacterized protein n=1 Tax=Nibrella saemangeumensis TaxID=1084526 RepID=A0ABP8MEX3_9BACT